ncbi:TM2 domain-containing protein [Geopsychrobacter electrodiphilus]|uniref:TM2 domain-containing protein n=1 Tax=Geopsychrobacter electrodiphilus TaxID=225196 RepID=UPI00037C3E99|nr:TM2 domain-containing protein [Geopsychrobacter electrodiphilus]
MKSHSLLVGYLLWIFGFIGAHRFYYGRPVSGTIYFFTLGFFFIGWLVDLLLIPGMQAKADEVFVQGGLNYDLAWILLTFLGLFGVHRFYQKKWLTGLVYLLTGGVFLLGIIYDYWTLNDQLSELNREGVGW